MKIEKIYSRSNFKIHNLHKEKQSKIFIVTTIIVIIIAYITATQIISAINPTIERQSRIIAKNTAEKICNEACKEVMENMKYEDLCAISKDINGNITMMTMNVININQVSSEVVLKMQEKMNIEENNVIKISLGSITGVKLLSGRGPSINVKLQMMGNVHTSVKSEIKEAGINQSFHKIYLDINTEMSMISPYKDTDEEITTEVLLAESVIIGKIPETFYNLDGVTKDDAINAIN